MKQGHSGSFLRRVSGQVEKRTSDRAFALDITRQKDLVALSERVSILPRITRIDGSSILMEFVDGAEGLTERNAYRLGASLRLLHDQTDFTHSCLTGVDWLIDLANTNLAQTALSLCISPDMKRHFEDDALIHSEPAQFIESGDGRIVFIDIEGIGRGSRYQDLGFIEYTTHLSAKGDLFVSCMQGYRSDLVDLDAWRIRQMAGLIAIAYSRFADTEKRLALGIQLMEEAEQYLADDVLQRA